MSDNNQTAAQDEEVEISFAEFLANSPPGKSARILDVAIIQGNANNVTQYELSTPRIRLHCASPQCNGIRSFNYLGPRQKFINTHLDGDYFIRYVCADCQQNLKTFAISARVNSGDISGICYKYGEEPQFGPPTPARLLTLIGPDRELYLKGRRCENQGLGVGAFAYYRRVVEDQKNRILDEIIKAAQKLKVPDSQIQLLENAKAETQFSRALANVKDALPESLLIDGHNPLSLLHAALSDGLHARSDAECLEVASSVRVVLVELSERLGQALRDEAEIHKAISRLKAPRRD